ncbi:MAG TPA: (2Fe-2S)-binding protein [Gaiellaceae bacterium]|nr:(2Fe-2S)-binding protein [Gaiellaceae bacterium]
MAAATLAERALAAGRPAVGSSFRFHRPRGPLCGRGYCFQCEVETPAGPVLACRSDIRLRRRPDPLRPLGRLAETQRPWFYERTLGRAGALDRAALELLRRVSAAGPLHGVPAGAARRFEELEVETVAVGDATRAPADALVVDEANGSLALGVYPGRVLGVLRGDSLAAVRFERLVLATGSYERLPPIAGNDLPGVMGLKALERYAPSLPRALRLAAWTRADQRARLEHLADEHGFRLVWTGTAPPRSLSGRGRVERVHAEETIACDLFVVGVAQPALELAQQAGARVELTGDGLPILAAVETPSWLELRGDAARETSGVSDIHADDAAFVCLCEDVRVGDVRACVADGFRHPELVKRRTGAMTGPCQGKVCAAAVLSVLREADVEPVAPTARPLARPVTLGELAAHA